jgi:hypothetical protein
MVLNDNKDHHPGIANSGPFLMMNPFSSRCCQHNHAQGWPYYSENLWQASSDNGVAAVLYASSQVSIKVGKGVPIKIDLKTNYPFEEKLEFTVHTSGQPIFPFYFRVPAWCATPKMLVNGKPIVTNGSTGRYLRIERTWKEGDTVTLRLPMAVTVRRWQKNHDSVSVNYGPLTFSLKIGEQYIERSSAATAIDESRWQKGVDSKSWPSFEIHATTPWHFGLILDDQDPAKSFTISQRPWPKSNFPFTLEECPISLYAKAKQIPEWQIDQYGLCGVLMDSPVRSDRQVEQVTLVPMGAARLRISAFPVIARD